MPTAKPTAAPHRTKSNEASITATHYDSAADAIVATLSTGSNLVVPRTAIPGFAKADPHCITDLAVMPGGAVLWSQAVDDGVHLDQLFVFAAGEDLLRRLGARAMGGTKTPRHAAASRANGVKGGRPRKKPSGGSTPQRRKKPGAAAA